MKERLVDVKKGKKVVHTFPVTISDAAAESKEEAFKEKALEAAAHAKVVKNAEHEGVKAELHVSRRGRLEPDDDPLGVLAETKPGLEACDRERAYLLWEQAGRPEGEAQKFWHQAQHERWCERAYALWEREGCPDGKMDEHWHRVREFEKD